MARPYRVTVTIHDPDTDVERRREWMVPDGVVLTNARLAPVGAWVISATAQLDAEVSTKDL